MVVGERDKNFPPCDALDGTPLSKDGSGKVTGTAHAWAPNYQGPNGVSSRGYFTKRNNKFVTTDPVFYTAPGTGSCGVKYTDQDVVACLKPGWVNSANKNGCNKWIEATIQVTGKRVTAQVVDSCGALAASDTTFDCGDLYLSLAAYSVLAGNDEKVIKAGRLPHPVQWSFIQEPCWACEQGLPGKQPDGSPDHCTSLDNRGEMRHGRKPTTKLVGAPKGTECKIKSPAESFNMQPFIDAANEKAAAQQSANQ
ncbi:hypothetical protein BCV69DRAFT_312300 [Microstroma glucosiphilum]|uniref:RlpA-like protein double-psi beta-barrel domain-containing protein n=1 Tax=Pseudomicrostroma glucosiphilum TaxID=1684307 RepID=A0A316U722_9BASI|nr:hypothetical protein BCV69DRAFT_312300 [Pseudomicrostroma glucosiphilum]PWN21030.1 hypothetical protein BCV69DRAFT_312300 [Pseudomicrostroma glucosiphilum]